VTHQHYIFVRIYFGSICVYIVHRLYPANFLNVVLRFQCSGKYFSGLAGSGFDAVSNLRNVNPIVLGLTCNAFRFGDPIFR
jgi:hypothetical protein